MVDSPSPNLAEIKRKASENEARALMVIAITELCDWFNVSRNMNDSQVAMLADAIIERFWYLKPEEVKRCFKQAMFNKTVYERLDPSIIMSWLREYEAERTEEAMRLSDNEGNGSVDSAVDNPEPTMSFEEFLSAMRTAAESGDEEAAALVESVEKRMAAADLSDTRQKRLDFMRWFYTRYLPSRK